MQFPTITKFHLDKVLEHSIKVYSEKFAQFLGISVLINLPMYLISIGLFDIGDAGTYMSLEWIGAITLLNLIFAGVLTSAIIKMSYAAINNEQVSLGSSLAVSIKYFIPLFVAIICVTILTMLGTVALIVPGLILMTMYYFTIPAVVMENVSPFAAMSRSSQLTDGYRWHIFGLIIIVGLINGFITQVLAGVFMKSNPAIYFNLLFIFLVIYTPFISIVQTVAYYHMRVIKENIDIDDLFQSFDK